MNLSNNNLLASKDLIIVKQVVPRGHSTTDDIDQQAENLAALLAAADLPVAIQANPTQHTITITDIEFIKSMLEDPTKPLEYKSVVLMVNSNHSADVAITTNQTELELLFETGAEVSVCSLSPDDTGRAEYMPGLRPSAVRRYWRYLERCDDVADISNDLKQGIVGNDNAHPLGSPSYIHASKAQTEAAMLHNTLSVLIETCEDDLRRNVRHFPMTPRD